MVVIHCRTFIIYQIVFEFTYVFIKVIDYILGSHFNVVDRVFNIQENPN